MKQILLCLLLLSTSVVTLAATTPFQLNISGENLDLYKMLELSDLGEGKTAIHFDFSDKAGNQYIFDLKYKKLPANRSFPGNLDITLSKKNGDKLGYLFFAINDTDFLKQMGVFGLIIDVNGKPVDIKFTFDKMISGNFSVADLQDERFVQDTLVPQYGFQMIRPVLVPLASPGVRSQSYSLDNHPFEVNYTLKDIANGLVQFQYNLNKKNGDKRHLLERIYFNADSLATLREGMFAGKYFDKDAGTFKLVFYPTLGQTTPLQQ